MQDRFGNKLNIGDLVLYYPYEQMAEIIEVIDELNIIILKTLNNWNFQFGLNPSRVELLPEDEVERNQYIMLRKLEL